MNRMGGATSGCSTHSVHMCYKLSPEAGIGKGIDDDDGTPLPLITRVEDALDVISSTNLGWTIAADDSTRSLTGELLNIPRGR